MKFKCTQNELTKALNIVSKAVSIRTTIPILKGILLKVDEEGFLTMSASDLDLSIEEKIKVNDSEKGSVVVMAKLFGDIIRKLPNEEILLEEVEGKVSIKCSNSEFNIVGLSADEFPNINPLEEGLNKISFDKELLKEMIKRTSFAASIDENNGAMTGVLLEMKEDSLTMVAIDGIRMAITRELMKNGENKKIIIPAKIINEISRIINESELEESTVDMVLSDKKAIFIINNIKVILRLLEGEFIDYNRIIPKENEIEITVNRNDLLDSVERASLLAKVGKNNLIKLNIKENEIEITSKSEEGSVSEKVVVSKVGKDLVIGFNSKYLIDILKATEEETIKLFMNTSISPCLIRPINGNNFEYLLLPVRISQ